MVVRTQVSLDAEQQKRARRKASELGLSFAEYIRRLVARDLVQGNAGADVSAVFDLGSSGGSDVARRKDEMLGEAVVAGHSKG